MISDYVRFAKVALRAKVDYPPFGLRLTHKIKTRLYLATFTPYQYLFFSFLIRSAYWLVMPLELIKRSHLSQVDDGEKKSTLKNLESDGYVKLKL